MNERQIMAHLLRRAGFGATSAELDFYLGLGFDAAVDRLVNYEAVDNSQLEADVAAQAFDLSRLDGCQSWWLYRMLFTRRPLEEKMTLFWHGHFATENRKVGRPPYMIVQNRLLRGLALGRFDELVLQVSQDPAMLDYLDGRYNGRRRPNENYARELMELFTLGIGNYTEQDIAEAARALTGWTIRDDRFFFNVSNHDTGTKTILGETGSFTGTDVCRIVCQQLACAPFIARKLIRFFVTDTPDPAFVTRVAEAFRGSGLNARAAVEVILRSPEFRSDASLRATVKSPIELVVGALKHLDIVSLASDFRSRLRQMQQELFNPPGVEGWDGGTTWLSTTTFLYRANFMQRITSGNTPDGQPFIGPLDIVARNSLTTNRQIVDYFVDRLLEGTMSEGSRQALVAWLDGTTSRNRLRRLRGLIHLVLTSATYQLN